MEQLEHFHKSGGSGSSRGTVRSFWGHREVRLRRLNKPQHLMSWFWVRSIRNREAGAVPGEYGRENNRVSIYIIRMKKELASCSSSQTCDGGSFRLPRISRSFS